MVAHLVGLRLLLLRNVVTRNVWQLIAVIFGGLYALFILVAAVVGLIGLGVEAPEFVPVTLVIGGSALILGWVIGPILVSGSDQSLDLPTLATFPIPRRTLLLGLTAAGFVGVPGIVTTLAGLATALAWIAQPAGIVPGLLAAAVGVTTCIVGSRLVGTLTSGLGSSRRYREIVGGVLLVLVILLGPLSVALLEAVQDGLDLLPVIAGVLSWTPLGAIWAVPGSVVAGAWGAALTQFAIGLATLAGLVLLWSAALGHALAEPAASHAQASSGAAGIGLFGRFPGTPTGAVAARALGYWLRDPRYSRGLFVIPAVVVLTLFYGALGDDGVGIWSAIFASVFIALILGVTLSADVAYDGTAWAAHVTSGVTGAADRAGRVIAAAVIAVPALLIVAIGTAWFVDSLDALPGILGVSFGLMLSGFGFSSVISARVVYPVPAPGDNPLKSPPGAGVMSSLVTFGSMAACFVLTLPEIALAAAAAITGQTVFGWLALLVGILLGGLFAVVGIRVGGRIVDRKAPELFAALVKIG